MRGGWIAPIPSDSSRPRSSRSRPTRTSARSPTSSGRHAACTSYPRSSVAASDHDLSSDCRAAVRVAGRRRRQLRAPASGESLHKLAPLGARQDEGDLSSWAVGGTGAFAARLRGGHVAAGARPRAARQRSPGSLDHAQPGPARGRGRPTRRSGRPYALAEIVRPRSAPVGIEKLPVADPPGFRIATLADSEAFSRTFAVAASPIPAAVKDLADPEGALVDICRRSRKASIRHAMTPPPNSRGRVGPEFRACSPSTSERRGDRRSPRGTPQTWPARCARSTDSSPPVSGPDGSWATAGSHARLD